MVMSLGSPRNPTLLTLEKIPFDFRKSRPLRREFPGSLTRGNGSRLLMTLIEVPLDSAPSEWEQLRAALVSIRISDAVSEVEPVPFSGRAPHILRKAESGFVGLERGNRSKATILTDGLELVQSF